MPPSDSVVGDAETVTGIRLPSNTAIAIGALSVTWSRKSSSLPPLHGRSYLIELPRSVTTGLSLGSLKLVGGTRSPLLSVEFGPDSGDPSSLNTVTPPVASPG